MFRKSVRFIQLHRHKNRRNCTPNAASTITVCHGTGTVTHQQQTKNAFSTASTSSTTTNNHHQHDSKSDEAMKNVLNNFAQNEEVESKRKIKKKDFVDIDFTGSFDGKEIEKLNRKNAIVEIGNETLIPEIEKEILTLKKGEESSFEVLYPKDFPISEAAEKKIKCKLKVNKILKK